jgi:glutamate carboxypeptidase
MKAMLPALLLAPLALAFAAPAHAELSRAEQAMADTIEAEFPRSIVLLERLVNQNSGTHNPQGVRAVAEMLRPEFEALGLQVEWINQAAAQRSGHLFVRHEGRPGTTRILLVAHLDTVFEPASPFQRFEWDGRSDTASGPGINDDKGGIITILLALQAMKVAGTLDRANIVIALTGDEESAGEPIDLARADLVAAAEWADVALDFEGLATQGGRDMGVIARRSSNGWTLGTRGRTGHSSQIFSANMGDGAVYEMARILSRFRTELAEPNATFNVGLLASGAELEVTEDGLSAQASGKGNIIPQAAHASGDLRTLSEEQTDRLVERMEAIAAENAPGTTAEFTFTRRYPAMPPTEGNRSLLSRLNAVNRDLGWEEQAEFDPAMRGAGDINFIAAQIDGLAGMGPGGSGSHAAGETVDLPSIKRQAKRAAILMSRLAAQPYP